jgi:hypothetical protein
MVNKIIAEDFILKKQDKKNFKKSIIERQNLTNEFTLEDVENHLFEMDKMERELTAQVRVSTAVIANVERNHPFVSKLSDEQLSVAIYLGEAKDIVRKSNAKLRDIKATKKKYKEVTDVVYKKFGFVPTELPLNEATEQD